MKCWNPWNSKILNSVFSLRILIWTSLASACTSSFVILCSSSKSFNIFLISAMLICPVCFIRSWKVFGLLRLKPELAYFENMNLNAFYDFQSTTSTNSLSLSSSSLRLTNWNVGSPFLFSLSSSLSLEPSANKRLTTISFSFFVATPYSILLFSNYLLNILFCIDSCRLLIQLFWICQRYFSITYYLTHSISAIALALALLGFLRLDRWDY